MAGSNSSSLRIIPLICGFCIGLLNAGCGDDGASPSKSDTVPPRRIHNLVGENADEGRITLRWTAPGDDESSGRATRYEIRHSLTPLVDGTWATATIAPNPPTPGDEGAEDTLELEGLSPGTWSFGIKAADEIPNWSPLSNVVVAAIGPSLAPAPVQDLAASLGAGLEVTFTWTAPGDDGNSGTATAYDLRYASAVLADSSWATATRMTGLPAPSIAGSEEQFVAPPLSPDRVYYFALRTHDNAGHLSALSNVVRVSTARDLDPPAPVLDLVASALTGRKVVLRWTAPGDDGLFGIAYAYELRYSANEITEENWAEATPVSDLPTPSPAGSAEEFSVERLELLTQYSFALRTTDEVPNTSALSNVASVTTANFWQLTEGRSDYAGAFRPDWAPDGTRLLFTGFKDGRGNLYVVAIDGGVPVQLTDHSASEDAPAWSPDGERIAFISNRGGEKFELFTMDAEAGAPATLLASEPRDIGQLAWSPDGTIVAYQTPRLASIVEAVKVRGVQATGGTPVDLIASGDDWGNFDPAYSPDGTRLAVLSTRFFSWDLFVVPLAGGAAIRLTHGPGLAQNTNPDWSPSGTELVFASNRGSNFDLYRLPIVGGAPILLAPDPANDSEPAWSPTGDLIAFSSDRSGNWEIWLVRVD